MIRKHSLNNWEKIKPQVKQRHIKVMTALDTLVAATMYEIAEHLNVPVHAISGRITELMAKDSTKCYDKALIEAVGTENNKYGNACTLYRIKEVQPKFKQQEMFK